MVYHGLSIPLEFHQYLANKTEIVMEYNQKMKVIEVIQHQSIQ